MMEGLADINDVIAQAMRAWRPPPRLSLSEWSEREFYLSAESAAEPGRWRPYPFQRGWMDAITDPLVERVTLMKSARVGYTKSIDAGIGYFIHQDPCSQLVVQPTVDDAKGFSKEEIAPMIRDCPALTAIVLDANDDAGPKDSGNTILHKKYPGGVLSMIGANSGAGFRRVTRRVVWFDEVDAYPPSAGSDGDPIKLGIMRTETFWNRKIIAGSTPLIAGRSRIERLYNEGDQRRYFVPCPQCEHMAPLVFRGDKGHHMTWPEDRPEDAYFVCQANGCVIEHKDKREMVSRGEWRAAAPFKGHASFHVWAAYSFSPNASWGQLASEFVAVKDRPEQLRTFVNTVLGETWQERGDAPEWERLYARREDYVLGSIPARVQFLTAGVDVQKDRVVYEVTGWSSNKESWLIDSGVIMLETANAAEWTRVDELLARTYVNDSGAVFVIRALAIDSGYNTQQVYNWVRRYPGSRVMAVKGVKTARALLGVPTAVDVTHNGQRLARGCKVWLVGTDIAKAELYGWLRLPQPESGVDFPAGFCHFPEVGPDYFKQLTAEQLVPIVNKRTGFVVNEWQVQQGRENHALDARIYSRAAAVMLGVDRLRPSTVIQPVPAPGAPPTPVQVHPQQPSQIPNAGPKGRLGMGNRVKGWLKR